MKNIHIIPTDKPSRLLYFGTSKELTLQVNPATFRVFERSTQNIYITSDEEIKEGDWFYNIISLKPEPFKACENGDGYVNCSKYSHYRIDCKKIILTTDQDLIADGVQAIDDEFLEWFVNNPSCESVETIYGLFNPMGRQVDPNNLGQNHSQCIWKHKIIIPQEEPKQELERGITITHVGKQETLEEDAKDFIENTMKYSFNSLETKTFANRLLKSVEFGAKWQAERMYSEEDMIAFAEFVAEHPDKNRNHKGEMLHAKSKYDGAERTIDLLEDFKKK